MNQPWIYMCSHPEPPSHLPPHPIPLGHPSAPAPSTCLMHPTWTDDLFYFLFVLFPYGYPIVPAPLKKTFFLLIHDSTSWPVHEVLLLDLHLSSIVLSIWISVLFHCFACLSGQKPYCLYLQITIRSLFFFFYSKES